MRGTIFLALVLSIAGFAACLVYFVLVNVRFETEPFATWSQLPYAGMFQYAGLVCILGAVIYLLMERQLIESQR